MIGKLSVQFGHGGGGGSLNRGGETSFSRKVHPKYGNS